MILVFHGDNIETSLEALDSHLKSHPTSLIYRFDNKDLDPNSLNLVLNSTSLLGEDNKTIVITNLFSTSKPILDKILPLLNQTTCDILIWQDKLLTPTQLKSLPQVKANAFRADNHLYKCLNAIFPGNIRSFVTSYHLTVNKGLYDLFLYLLKGNLRRQLTTYSKFPTSLLSRTYLQIIELEYLYKSGQLTLSKDIALERIILNLIK